jgi:archaellum component FlaC
MRRRRHPKYPPTGGAAGSDTEALQTDVMRFMSIIGLCLMAVFALVQGIPVQDKAKTAMTLQAARLREDVRVQQLEAEQLQVMLQALNAEMQRTRRSLAVAEQDLDQVSGLTQRVRDEHDRLQAEMQILERQLAQGRRELTDIEQAAIQRQQDLARLNERVRGVQQTLQDSRRKLTKLKRRVARAVPGPTPGPVAATRPAPAQVARPAPDRRGFTLRFVSDEALDRLVGAGSVTLYAMADRRAWRLSLDAGRAAAARGPYPGWFHEMSETTVPEHYIQGLDNAPDGPGTSAVVWGVQLPASTREAIASLTRGQPGGELVIRGDGRVLLED